MKTDLQSGQKFQELVSIMARLRAPGGGPWDREQTFDSIKPYTLEETYEGLDAIDRPGLSGPSGGTGRLSAASGLLRGDGGGAGPFPDRRCAGCDQQQADPAASARVRQRIGGDGGGCEAHLGRGEVGGEKRQRRGSAGSAGLGAAGA